MFNIIYIICIIFFCDVRPEHPFKISVSEIKYDGDLKEMQVDVKLFLDDFEIALRDFSGNRRLNLYDKSDSVYLGTQVEKYISEKVQIHTDQPLSLIFLGMDYEDLVLWCHFQVENVEPFNSMLIENTLLLHVFDSQENLVKVNNNGKQKSLRFSLRKTRLSLEW
ncbi:hypothetical protein GCM10028791_28520 [Echinicola sediminis]